MYFYSHAREGRDAPKSPSESAGRISTHTPARGVTVNKIICNWLTPNFYSHAREGRDIPLLHCTITNTISTHTPARGVTFGFPCNDYSVVDFYSHAREGRDQYDSEAVVELWDFYSHAREGRDANELFISLGLVLFLLTRPRGA